jgi:hypothetical protein
MLAQDDETKSPSNPIRPLSFPTELHGLLAKTCSSAAPARPCTRRMRLLSQLRR